MITRQPCGLGIHAVVTLAILMALISPAAHGQEPSRGEAEDLEKRLAHTEGFTLRFEAKVK